MFTPNTPTQEDLSDYDRMRLAALAPPPPPPASAPAAPPPQFPAVAPPPGGFGPPPPQFPAVAPPPGGFGPNPEYPIPALSPINARPADQTLAGETAPAMPPPARPPSAMARVSAPAQPRPAPASAPSEQDFGPAPQSGLTTFLRALPNALGNIASAAAAKGRYGTDIAMREITRRNGENAAMFAGAERDQKQYANRKRFLTRQGKQDALAAEDRSRKMAREDKADALSNEATDPNSEKNKLFRQTIAKEYPGVWSFFTPEQQASLTIANADAFGPSVEAEGKRADLAAAATAKEKARQEGMEDKKALIDYRKKGKGGGGGYAAPVAGGPDDPSQVKAALAQTYGGEDKIPPAVMAELNLAVSAKNPDKRRAAIASVLSRVQAQKNKEKDDTVEVEKGFEIIDPVAYDKANLDAGSRKAMRGVMTSAPTIEKSLAEMKRIRAVEGSNVIPNQDSAEYELHRGAYISALGELNNAGVLQPSDLVRFSAMAPSLTPGASDVVRIVPGQADPTLERLKGGQKAFRDLMQKKLAGYGVRPAGTGGTPPPKEATPKEASGGDTITMKDPKTGKTGPVHRSNLKKALERGLVEVQ